MFEVKGATFEINGKSILNPIDHSFHEGKVYGLIGHNGSGKSTLIKLMAQQQPVSQGEIHFDPWHGLLGRHTQKDKDAIDRAIALTHTEAFADRLVDTLSGGERQRVWLAMLLAQGSRFLLLDEPLAALDIAHQIEVLALIRKLCDELNLGVIIVLHDINMASRYCDELMALHSGPWQSWRFDVL